jgi:hypothetical protein
VEPGLIAPGVKEAAVDNGKRPFLKFLAPFLKNVFWKRSSVTLLYSNALRALSPKIAFRINQREILVVPFYR